MKNSKRAAPRLFSVAEVADLMSVSIKTVRRRIGAGELRFHQTGRLIRVSEDDYNAFVAAGRR